MTAATVLVPTYDHGETLRYSVPTALAQTVRDIEVVIIGDGVSDATRSLVGDLVKSDPRVTFVDYPKAPSRGEIYRHRFLLKATGDIVCYLFDDDLWLPDHIETMIQLLREADLALSMPVVVGVEGTLIAEFLDLSRDLDRELFVHRRSGAPSVPTCVAHTLSMYHRLPHGWRTTPPGQPPDKYMWAQFASHPGCRMRSTSKPTALVFPDPPRRHWPPERRLAELAIWSERVHSPEWRESFPLEVVDALARSSPMRTRVLRRHLQLRLPVPDRWIRAVVRTLRRLQARQPPSRGMTS